MGKKNKIILRIGFEGGGITLWGRKISEEIWQYATSTNESALAELLSDEDADLLDVLVTEQNHWVNSFDESIGLLEKYPWRRGYPTKIHPEFRALLWNHVIAKRPPLRNLMVWAEACDVELDTRIVTLADWIQKSKFTVVLTGAGISTASGVSDFRSESGWWKNIDPTTVATANALKNNYETFHEFYSFRIHALEGLSPNQIHHILAKWEKLGFVKAVVTQNVDGFHQMAGSQRVYELHGSILSACCALCANPVSKKEFIDRGVCPKCGGRLRPNVTLFDEPVPAKAWEEATKTIAEADLVIAIGTSLNVYPANRLPSMTKGKAAVVNLEPTKMDGTFDLVIHGKSEDMMTEVDKWIGSSRILKSDNSRVRRSKQNEMEW